MLQSEAGYIDARPPPPIRRNLLATHGRTIHAGHFRPDWAVRVMSASPPIATELRTLLEVRFVPRPEQAMEASRQQVRLCRLRPDCDRGSDLLQSLLRRSQFDFNEGQ
jgi:hypothetical protein